MDSAPKLGRWRVGSLGLDAVQRVPLLPAVLLVLGIQLRVAMWLAYSPVVVNVRDEIRYAFLARDGIFLDPGAPGGYPMILKALHAISDDVELVVAMQHLLGIATALVLYAAIRRLGAPVWVAAAAPAAILLSLDQVFLEHALLTESLFGFMLAVMVYGSVRALEPAQRLGSLAGRAITTRLVWILLSAATVGLAIWVRPPAVALVPVLVAWLGLAIPGPKLRRVSRAALALGIATLVVGVYFSLNASETGYFGLTQPGAAGWGLYSRVGQFADCSEFDPPAGTEVLCEAKPPSRRGGPDFYGSFPGSPAVRTFGHSPVGGDALGAFARAAIEGQPGDYALAVLKDVARYFIPGYNDGRRFAGTDYGYMDIAYHPPDSTEIQMAIESYYGPQRLDRDSAVNALGELQDVLRVHPILMLAAMLMGAVGVTLARGSTRATAALLLLSALVLLVLPVAVAVYSARYSVPVAPLLVAAGAIGVWVPMERIRGRAEPRPAE